MAEAKQILVIDDHFEMLELLRSMLEMSEQDYEVLAVPSAEEGLLELLRTPFDLLITDVRLPGMSGFDLVRRVRQQRPHIPVIMLTAYSSEQGREEAQDLGVHRYFSKPLDTDEVLTAVHHALFGEPVLSDPAPEPLAAIDFAMPRDARKRLESLRADTGAAGLFLATVAGQILFEIEGNLDLSIDKVATTIAQNVQSSFLLAGQLEEDEPLTIQYHVGRGVSLYHANVGRDYFVTLLFRSQARRGRIGTIWVFTQRAIRELQEILPPLTAVDSETLAASPTAVSPAAEKSPGDKESVAEMANPSTPSPAPAESSSDSMEDDPLEPFAAPPDTGVGDGVTKETFNELLAALDLDESVVADDVDSFWDQALADAGGGKDDNTLSWEEASELVSGLRQASPESEVEGGSSGAGDAIGEEAEVDLNDLLAALDLDETAVDSDVDAFWEDALHTDEAGANTTGLSFEEAKEQGLIPSQEEDEE